MTDVWLPRLGVVMLGLMAVGAAVGCTAIVMTGRDIPTTLAVIGVYAAARLSSVVIALIRRENGGNA